MQWLKATVAGFVLIGLSSPRLANQNTDMESFLLVVRIHVYWRVGIIYTVHAWWIRYLLGNVGVEFACISMWGQRSNYTPVFEAGLWRYSRASKNYVICWTRLPRPRVDLNFQVNRKLYHKGRVIVGGGMVAIWKSWHEIIPRHCF